MKMYNYSWAVSRVCDNRTLQCCGNTAMTLVFASCMASQLAVCDQLCMMVDAMGIGRF